MKNMLRSSIICLLAVLLISAFYSTVDAQTNDTSDSIVQITTILPGTTEPQMVHVSVKNGLATMEGDITLGLIQELQDAQDRGIVKLGDQYRWPNGEIPYVIEPGFTQSYIVLIKTAIDYINGSSHLLVVPRQSQSDYVHFVPDTVCESYVGRLQSGTQNIKLKDVFAPANNGGGCFLQQIIHEIGHAAGLWHEQSRSDRDNFVTIHPVNIKDGQAHNFNKHVADGIDRDAYDFNSIMHYRTTEFSKNGQPTITANNGQAFGNATEYSIGDIAAINWMYPVNNCPSNFTLSINIPVMQQPMVFEVSNTVISTAKIFSGNNIVYDAASTVILSPGFQALAGSIFKAVNEGCGGIYQRGSNPEVEEWMASAENSETEPQPVNGHTEPTALPDLNISPNPFSGSTTITYTLSVGQKVDIQILSVVGNLVAQPVRQEYQDPGKHEYYFRAEDLPTGVYFLVMQTGGQKLTKRLVLAH